MGTPLTLADVSFKMPGEKAIEGSDLAKLIEFGSLSDLVYSLLGLASLIDQDSLEVIELRHVCVTLRTLAEAIAPHNVCPDDAQRCEVLIAEPEAAPAPPEDGGNVRALRPVGKENA